MLPNNQQIIVFCSLHILCLSHVDGCRPGACVVQGWYKVTVLILATNLRKDMTAPSGDSRSHKAYLSLKILSNIVGAADFIPGVKAAAELAITIVNIAEVCIMI